VVQKRGTATVTPQELKAFVCRSSGCPEQPQTAD
jgi:hypothetical protein